LQVQVAPDASSIDIYVQLEGSIVGTRRFVSGGLFGPATKDQNKPNALGPLLDLPFPPDFSTPWQTENRIAADSLPEILTYMREGLTYISFISSSNGQLQEELRGQLVVSTCLEAQLQRNSSSVPFIDANGETRLPYAFANILYSSPDFALQVQVRDASFTPAPQRPLHSEPYNS
jgi:hypothetical protein